MLFVSIAITSSAGMPPEIIPGFHRQESRWEYIPLDFVSLGLVHHGSFNA
jgi:hypothetical protein